MPESCYQTATPSLSRLVHRYGDNVHILSDPWSLSLLARLCHPDCGTQDAHLLLDACTQHLIHAACEQLPRVTRSLPTRMTAKSPSAAFEGSMIDPAASAVVVDIARGGIIPSTLFHRALMHVLVPTQVRVDHLYLQRVHDAERGGIGGVHHAGSKIGGDVAGATVFIPDPMAATGSSVSYVLDVYRRLPGGRPRKLVMCHLIVTPEYLLRVAKDAPDVVVYALRLDRGRSSEDVLATVPGTRWAEERGLDDDGYILPGAGGIGEVLNNAWV